MDAHLADVTAAGVRYAADTGTANVKEVALPAPVPTAYVEGMAIAFKNSVQNTGAVTINVNGLGAKSILKSNGSAISSGNLKANSIYTIRYNGTAFILQGEGGEYGTATAEDVLSGKTLGTDGGVIAGTLPSKVGSGTIIVASATDQPIPKGYYGGTASDGKVKALNVTAGNNLALSSLESYRLLTYNQWTKTKEAKINYSGTVRVVVTCSTNANPYTSRLRLYKNGVAVGQERLLPQGSPTTYTEDIAVSAGDVIQVYALLGQEGLMVDITAFKISIAEIPYITPIS